VNGATYEILYGEDANQNGVLDPNEDDGEESPPVDNRDGRLERGMLSYLTCFSRESNMRSDGTTARVDITASSTQLRELLEEKLGFAVSQDVLNALSGPYGAGGTPPRSIAEFYKLSGMSADDLGKIIGDLSASPATAEFIDCKINVNTASEAVLACIPGVAEKASAIVAARSQRATVDENIAWFVDALENITSIRLAGPYITGRVSVISADVAAVGRNGRGYRRTRFIIDKSSGTPQVVYRRNLSGLGWALGPDARQILAQQKEAR
jgi:hypothetical protein